MSEYKNLIAFRCGQVAFNEGDHWQDNPYKKDRSDQERDDRHDWQLGYNRQAINLQEAHSREI